jgi:hypothetical protein
MLETRSRHFDEPFSLTCVEPHPERLMSLLRPEDQGTCEILQQPVQDVPTSRFSELAENDILFVDSSHVAKVGSDVLDIFYRVLPALRPGVLVHIHDIPWPFEYPMVWFEEGRAWNEAYFLRSFLQFNTAFQVEFFNDYLVQRFTDTIGDALPTMLQRASSEVNLGASSIWLRRV